MAEIEPHADKLHIMRFDWGTGKWTCVLCGMVDDE